MQMRLQFGGQDTGKNKHLGKFTRDLSRVKYLFHPHGATMKHWDLLMMALLVFTATVTPYEVAFLVFKINWLFAINRIVDFFFLLDLIFQFFIPLGVSESTVSTFDSELWNISRKDIAIHYLRSWFIVDGISIFPFDSLQLALEGNNAMVGQMRVLRILRCARLMKLLRTMRIGRLLSRWQQRLNLSFRSLHLCKFLMGGITACHWMACIWRIIPSLEMENDDWVTKYYGTGPLETTGAHALEHLQGPSELYIASLYWAVMTLTTIGYGDVTPHTKGEMIFSIFAMALGAATYAYLVGDVCGEIGNGDPLGIQFRQKMDCVKNFMDAHGLPGAMRHKLRVFFYSSEELMRNEMYKAIIDDLSPTLRGEVIAIVHSKWLSKVRMLTAIPADEKVGFISALVGQMQAVAYAKDDYILRRGDFNENIFIVQKGTVLRCDLMHAKSFEAGNVFCTDVIVSRRHARSRYSWVSISYVIVHAISSGEVQNILADPRFGETRKVLRKQAFKLLLVQNIGMYSKVFQKFMAPVEHGGGEYVPAEHIQTKRYMDGARQTEEQGSAAGHTKLGNDVGQDRGATYAKKGHSCTRYLGKSSPVSPHHSAGGGGDVRLKTSHSNDEGGGDSTADEDVSEIRDRLDHQQNQIDEVLRLLRAMSQRNR
jgi:hypothetical protein